jgi:hypothetical protein
VHVLVLQIQVVGNDPENQVALQIKRLIPENGISEANTVEGLLVFSLSYLFEVQLLFPEQSVGVFRKASHEESAQILNEVGSPDWDPKVFTVSQS